MTEQTPADDDDAALVRALFGSPELDKDHISSALEHTQRKPATGIFAPTKENQE